LFVGAVLLGGCATSTPLPSEFADNQWIQTLGAAEPGGSLNAEKWGLLERGDSKWVHATGERAGRMVIIGRVPTTEHGATTLLHDGDERGEYLRLDESGNVVLTAGADRGEDALSLFDPPMIIAPATLPHVTPHEQADISMRVIDLDNAKNERESGTATRRIELVGTQVIRTPLGEMQAMRVESDFKADLKLADVHEHAVFWIVPGRGIVAEDVQESTQVLGAFETTKRRTLVRVEK